MTDPNDLRKIEKWMAENKADKMLTIKEPVAWMVARNGEPCHLSWTLADAKKERNRLELVSTGTPALELFSLYRSPTLTDSEREAIENAITLRLCDAKWEEDRNGTAGNARARKAKREADTLLKLLERLK